MGRVLVEVLGAIVGFLGAVLANAPGRDGPLSLAARLIFLAMIGGLIILGAWDLFGS